MDFKKLVKRLGERGTGGVCPRCHYHRFTIRERFIKNGLHTDPASPSTVQGELLSSVVLICKRCGFISQHALDVLENEIEDND